MPRPGEVLTNQGEPQPGLLPLSPASRHRGRPAQSRDIQHQISRRPEPRNYISPHNRAKSTLTVIPLRFHFMPLSSAVRTFLLHVFLAAHDFHVTHRALNLCSTLKVTIEGEC